MRMNYGKGTLYFLLLSLLLSFIVACQKSEDKSTGVTVLEGMVPIPAGEFIMGSNDVDTEMLQQRFGMIDIPYQDEHPERKVHLDTYYIDKYEVANGQYKAFLDDAEDILPYMSHLRMMPFTWKKGAYPDGEGRLPVIWVSWHSAKAYCAWSGKRLPTEAEWEKAARGTDGRKFPWGDEFDDKKANSMGLSGGAAPVGTFKGDVSPYGVYDMAGNVREWVDDWYKSYPGNKFQNENYGEKDKVTRGWSWGGIGHYIMPMFYRASRRAYIPPEQSAEAVGFRCAWSEWKV